MKMTDDGHLEPETSRDKMALGFGLGFTVTVLVYLIYYLVTHPVVVFMGHP